MLAELNLILQFVGQGIGTGTSGKDSISVNRLPDCVSLPVAPFSIWPSQIQNSGIRYFAKSSRASLTELTNSSMDMYVSVA